MAKATPVAYNTGSTISNTLQIGSLAIATGNTALNNAVRWWNGPDEDLGYVVAVPVSGGTQPTPDGVNAYIGFYRSKLLTDASFISLSEFLSNRTQTFASGSAAKTWLNNNGYWTSYTGSTVTYTPQVAAGSYTSFYISSEGVAYSWGDGNLLGDNTFTNKSTPVAVCGGLTFSQISVGYPHALGITRTGIAYGWGISNVDTAFVVNSNAIGTNEVTETFYGTPVAVCGGLTFSQIRAGFNFSLGLTTGGIAYGWGENYNSDANFGGQLGINSQENKITPVAICGGLTFSQISAGATHSLGITTTGVAYAWGVNSSGTLGINNQLDKSTPVAVCGGLTFCQISAGSGYSLGITTTGLAYAWGLNDKGQLGDNTTTNRTTPVAICGGLTFCQISAGYYGHALGITTTGLVYAWGFNDVGQLGDNTTVSRRTPVAVCGGLTFSQIDTGYYHSVGITTTGVVYAWGDNSAGQLGDGTLINKSTPIAVCPKW